MEEKFFENTPSLQREKGKTRGKGFFREKGKIFFTQKPRQKNEKFV
jgi:hypothetical protein